MEKRYQVFVSSTYADLKEERHHVIRALIEMDCIPAGMELFPASDEQQWEFIKKIINDCDYYLLIIGGRYGSLTLEGISYTEKEYDYAVNIGLKVMALLHEHPDLIAIGKSDTEPYLRDQLQAFRDKVSTGRLEPISKLLEEHGDAGELHKAEKIRSVVLPAYEEPSFPLEPRKEALNEPATLIPT